MNKKTHYIPEPWVFFSDRMPPEGEYVSITDGQGGHRLDRVYGKDDHILEWGVAWKSLESGVWATSYEELGFGCEKITSTAYRLTETGDRVGVIEFNPSTRRWTYRIAAPILNEEMQAFASMKCAELNRGNNNPSAELPGESCPECGGCLSVILSHPQPPTGEAMFGDGDEAVCESCGFKGNISVDPESGEVWLQD